MRKPDLEFNQWSSFQLRRRSDVAVDELDGDRQKPSRSWLALSGPRLTDQGITVAVPMTTGQNRRANVLLADNGEIPDDSPDGASTQGTGAKVRKPRQSYVDCQQPWTVLNRRAIGPGHSVLADTPQRVSERLDRYIAVGFPSDEEMQQGSVVCCNVRPRFHYDKNSDAASLRAVAKKLFQFDPGNPYCWRLPAIVISSNRYLRLDQRGEEPVLDLVTVVPLVEDERLTGPNAPRVQARDAQGRARWFGPVTPFIMTLHRRGEVFGYGDRIETHHPQFEGWDVPAAVLHGVIEEASGLLGGTGGNP